MPLLQSMQKLNAIRQFVVVLIVYGSLCGQTSFAADHPILYLFWGAGCPHCEAEKEFLTTLKADSPQLEMHWFEVWDHREFAQLADALCKTYNIKACSVPLTFLGDWGNVGFLSAETTGIEIAAHVQACLAQGCPDTLDQIGPQQLVPRIRTEAASNAPQDWELYPATPAAASAITPQPPQTASKIVVYYFHTTYRCQSCTTIEQYTEEALKEAFAAELKSGVIDWQPLNLDPPDKQHFIQDYKLYTKSVIVSDVRAGKEQRWKNLPKVWELLRDEKAFKDYVKQEIAAYLKEQAS